MRHAPRLLTSVLVCSLALGCSSKVPKSTAKQISSRADLVGGPGALGEVGDYLLANEQIRVVIQGPGYSRGFGLYGGSLIDADLQRPRTAGDSAGGKGHDNFAELFPALFLKAMKPRENGISVREAPDGSASVLVNGTGDEFLFIAERINDLLVDSTKLIFTNEYKLAPGKRYVEITTTIINQGDVDVEMPGRGITELSEQLTNFTMPVGDVLLFGAGNHVFSEQAGFDLRFTLEQKYREGAPLPKLPGLVTPFLATKGDNISYGFMSGITDPEYSFVARTGYEGVPPDSLVIPFIAASFTGTYYGAAPSLLESRKSFSFKKYFIVGSGDIASIRDVVHEIWREKQVPGRPQTFGTFAGKVFDERTRAPLAGVDVVTFDASGGPYNQHTPDASGSFRGTYAPGRYTYRVVADGRFSTDPVAFEVTAGSAAYADIFVPPAGLVSVRVRDQDGRALPAKCTLVGQYPAAAKGLDPKDFLYDLKLGEEMRPTDLVPDTDDPSTREYIEHIVLAPQGQKTDEVRPGTYRAVCSRGMEYDLATRDVVVKAGELTEVDVVLTHVVDTKGWASGDYHLHSDPSIDSSLLLDDRVAHCAAEGLDIAVSSDHNFVTDYAPVIASQGLESWVQGMVGLELTTLEVGHFNGFPLSYDPGPVTKGSFAWSGRPPAELFADLRALGKYGPENMVIQVNHPRDTILGYFNDYNFNPDTGEVEDSEELLAPMGPEFGADKFDWNFDAIEIYNGKRFELLRTYRVPEVLPPPPLPMTIPPAGTILRDDAGKIAFPGGLEDWFTMLNKGFVYTAMANSDSHGLDEEPGTPRTYVPVSVDQPGAIIEPEIVAAIKNQKAMLTNGPFIRIEATGTAKCRNQKGDELTRDACGMGEVVSSSSGSITVRVTNDMAPWIDIDTVSFISNGETVVTRRGDKNTLAELSEQIPIDGDGFVLVEVSGSQSMWPVLTPLEVPSIQISDALGSIGGAFGVDFNPFGNLSPARTSVTRPYAFTNPIFVDGDGDGRYQARGVAMQALRAKDEPRVPVRRTDVTGIPSLVKIFSAFAAHAHH